MQRQLPKVLRPKTGRSRLHPPARTAMPSSNRHPTKPTRAGFGKYMDPSKPKEPLAAVLWTLIFLGAGHIYAAEYRRALVIIGLCLAVTVYVMHSAVAP